MSENEVYVAYGDNAGETATLLLAAAEESKDHQQEQVRAVEGGFMVPKEIADKAGADYDDPDEDDETKAKKSAAKKSAPAKK